MKSLRNVVGLALDQITFNHPLADIDEGYRRVAPIYLGDYVTLDTGTGVVHSAPAYGVEDFQSCKANGMQDANIINPVMGGWQICPFLTDFLVD